MTDDMLLQRLAARVKAASVNQVATPISRFTRNYGLVLDRATAGQLQVLSRHGEQFVLLSMAQVRNLIPPEDQRTMAELFAGLPTLSGRPPLRAQSPGNAATAADQYRLPPGLQNSSRWRKTP
ncbi:hypothetical protein [Polaromonas glacialis]|uniref:hypothetical protein n=1 Tax=Polaromonas glacialis TaxID=866564 RepID=UPI001E3B8CDC|nr:hypothetical protein [Polaromonas glacialis]